MIATLQVGNEAKERGEGMEKKEGEREGRKGKVVGRGEETLGLAQVAQCFHLDLRVLLKGLRVAYLKRPSDAETKSKGREKERGGEGEREQHCATLIEFY